MLHPCICNAIPICRHHPPIPHVDIWHSLCVRRQQQLTWDDGGVKTTYEVEMEITGVERLRAALGSATRGDAADLNAIAQCTTGVECVGQMFNL